MAINFIYTTFSIKVRDAITSVAAQTKAYLSFHSYGQYFLYSWGWTTALPDDWRDLDNLAKDATTKLEAVYGTKYTYGSAATELCKFRISFCTLLLHC